MLLIAVSIVEASKRCKKYRKGRNKKKNKGKKSALTTPSGSGEGTLVEHSSGPRLESEKARENKASVGGASPTVEGGGSEVLSSAASDNGAESDDALGKEFWRAVDEEDFEWLKENHVSWWNRRDLLDEVVARGIDVTVWFIQSVDVLEKRRVLAALFDKGEQRMIDSVLGRFNYDDNDLYDLTNYRPELAGSPEKFFRVLDRIEDPEKQELTVQWGVRSLFVAGRHDLVVPLVNALGKRTFKSRSLEGEAILTAFYEGAKRGNQDIVELYYEHLVITSDEYAIGLYWSWNNGKPNQVFQILLGQTDQGDLDKAKEKYAGKYYEQFRQAIDKAPKPVPPAGSRHRRSD